jgi:hypothetical protein
MMGLIQRLWRAALAMAAILTTPKVTPGASDQSFADVLCDSWLFAAGRDVSQAVRAAWQDATIHTWSRRLMAPVALSSGAHRVRLAAVTGAAAGCTALALGALGPVWAAPFTWVLPAAVTLIACVAFAAAEPLSRAIAARCS